MVTNIYKFALHKSYFDKGYGTTSMMKYVLAGMGIATRSPGTIFIMGVVYAIFCYVIGRTLYKIGYVESEAEVANQYNLFQKEMRSKFGIPNNRKI